MKKKKKKKRKKKISKARSHYLHKGFLVSKEGKSFANRRALNPAHVIFHVHIEQPWKREGREQISFPWPVNLPQAVTRLRGEKRSHVTAVQATLMWPHWDDSLGTWNSGRKGQTGWTRHRKVSTVPRNVSAELAERDLGHPCSGGVTPVPTAIARGPGRRWRRSEAEARLVP